MSQPLLCWWAPTRLSWQNPPPTARAQWSRRCWWLQLKHQAASIWNIKRLKLTLLVASQAETFCKHAADLESSKTFLAFGLSLYNLYTPLPSSSFKQFVSAVFFLCFGYMRNTFPPSIRATCSWPSKIQRGWRAGPTNPSANPLAQKLLGKKHPGTHGIWTPAVRCQEPCKSCMMIQGNFLNGTSNSLIRWNSSIPSIPNIHRILPGLEEFPSWSVPLPLSPWIGRRPFREECHDWMSWKPRWTHRWSTIAAPEGNICRSRKEAT